MNRVLKLALLTVTVAATGCSHAMHITNFNPRSPRRRRPSRAPDRGDGPGAFRLPGVPLTGRISSVR